MINDVQSLKVYEQIRNYMTNSGILQNVTNNIKRVSLFRNDHLLKGIEAALMENPEIVGAESWDQIANNKAEYYAKYLLRDVTETAATFFNEQINQGIDQANAVKNTAEFVNKNLSVFNSNDLENPENVEGRSKFVRLAAGYSAVSNAGQFGTYYQPIIDGKEYPYQWIQNPLDAGLSVPTGVEAAALLMTRDTPIFGGIHDLFYGGFGKARAIRGTIEETYMNPKLFGTQGIHGKTAQNIITAGRMGLSLAEYTLAHTVAMATAETGIGPVAIMGMYAAARGWRQDVYDSVGLGEQYLPAILGGSGMTKYKKTNAARFIASRAFDIVTYTASMKLSAAWNARYIANPTLGFGGAKGASNFIKQFSPIIMTGRDVVYDTAFDFITHNAIAKPFSKFSDTLPFTGLQHQQFDIDDLSTKSLKKFGTQSMHRFMMRLVNSSLRYHKLKSRSFDGVTIKDRRWTSPLFSSEYWQNNHNMKSTQAGLTAFFHRIFGGELVEFHRYLQTNPKAAMQAKALIGNEYDQSKDVYTNLLNKGHMDRYALTMAYLDKERATNIYIASMFRKDGTLKKNSLSYLMDNVFFSIEDALNIKSKSLNIMERFGKLNSNNIEITSTDKNGVRKTKTVNAKDFLMTKENNFGNIIVESGKIFVQDLSFDINKINKNSAKQFAERIKIMQQEGISNEDIIYHLITGFKLFDNKRLPNHYRNMILQAIQYEFKDDVNFANDFKKALEGKSPVSVRFFTTDEEIIKDTNDRETIIKILGGGYKESGLSDRETKLINIQTQRTKGIKELDYLEKQIKDLHTLESLLRGASTGNKEIDLLIQQLNEDFKEYTYSEEYKERYFIDKQELAKEIFDEMKSKILQNIDKQKSNIELESFRQEKKAIKTLNSERPRELVSGLDFVKTKVHSFSEGELEEMTISGANERVREEASFLLAMLKHDLQGSNDLFSQYLYEINQDYMGNNPDEVVAFLNDINKIIDKDPDLKIEGKDIDDEHKMLAALEAQIRIAAIGTRGKKGLLDFYLSEMNRILEDFDTSKKEKIYLTIPYLRKITMLGYTFSRYYNDDKLQEISVMQQKLYKKMKDTGTDIDEFMNKLINKKKAKLLKELGIKDDKDAMQIYNELQMEAFNGRFRTDSYVQLLNNLNDGLTTSLIYLGQKMSNKELLRDIIIARSALFGSDNLEIAGENLKLLVDGEEREYTPEDIKNIEDVYMMFRNAVEDNDKDSFYNDPVIGDKIKSFISLLAYKEFVRAKDEARLRNEDERNAFIESKLNKFKQAIQVIDDISINNGKIELKFKENIQTVIYNDKVGIKTFIDDKVRVLPNYRIILEDEAVDEIEIANKLFYYKEKPYENPNDLIREITLDSHKAKNTTLLDVDYNSIIEGMIHYSNSFHNAKEVVKTFLKDYLGLDTLNKLKDGDLDELAVSLVIKNANPNGMRYTMMDAFDKVSDPRGATAAPDQVIDVDGYYTRSGITIMSVNTDGIDEDKLTAFHKILEKDKIIPITRYAASGKILYVQLPTNAKSKAFIKNLIEDNIEKLKQTNGFNFPKYKAINDNKENIKSFIKELGDNIVKELESYKDFLSEITKFKKEQNTKSQPIYKISYNENTKKSFTEHIGEIIKTVATKDIKDAEESINVLMKFLNSSDIGLRKDGSDAEKLSDIYSAEEMQRAKEQIIEQLKSNLIDMLSQINPKEFDLANIDNKIKEFFDIEVARPSASSLIKDELKKYDDQIKNIKDNIDRVRKMDDDSAIRYMILSALTDHDLLKVNERYEAKRLSALLTKSAFLNTDNELTRIVDKKIDTIFSDKKTVKIIFRPNIMEKSRSGSFEMDDGSMMLSATTMDILKMLITDPGKLAIRGSQLYKTQTLSTMKAFIEGLELSLYDYENNKISDHLIEKDDVIITSSNAKIVGIEFLKLLKERSKFENIEDVEDAFADGTFIKVNKEQYKKFIKNIAIHSINKQEAKNRAKVSNQTVGDIALNVMQNKFLVKFFNDLVSKLNNIDYEADFSKAINTAIRSIKTGVTQIGSTAAAYPLGIFNKRSLKRGYALIADDSQLTAFREGDFKSLSEKFEAVLTENNIRLKNSFFDIDYQLLYKLYSEYMDNNKGWKTEHIKEHQANINSSKKFYSKYTGYTDEENSEYNQHIHSMLDLMSDPDKGIVVKDDDKYFFALERSPKKNRGQLLPVQLRGVLTGGVTGGISLSTDLYVRREGGDHDGDQLHSKGFSKNDWINYYKQAIHTNIDGVKFSALVMFNELILESYQRQKNIGNIDIEPIGLASGKELSRDDKENPVGKIIKGLMDHEEIAATFGNKINLVEIAPRKSEAEKVAEESVKDNTLTVEQPGQKVKTIYQRKGVLTLNNKNVNNLVLFSGNKIFGSYDIVNVSDNITLGNTTYRIYAAQEPASKQMEYKIIITKQDSNSILEKIAVEAHATTYSASLVTTLNTTLQNFVDKLQSSPTNEKTGDLELDTFTKYYSEINPKQVSINKNTIRKSNYSVTTLDKFKEILNSSTVNAKSKAMEIVENFFGKSDTQLSDKITDFLTSMLIASNIIIANSKPTMGDAAESLYSYTIGEYIHSRESESGMGEIKYKIEEFKTLPKIIRETVKALNDGKAGNPLSKKTILKFIKGSSKTTITADEMWDLIYKASNISLIEDADAKFKWGPATYRSILMYKELGEILAEKGKYAPVHLFMRTPPVNYKPGASLTIDGETYYPDRDLPNIAKLAHTIYNFNGKSLSLNAEYYKKILNTDAFLSKHFTKTPITLSSLADYVYRELTGPKKTSPFRLDLKINDIQDILMKVGIKIKPTKIKISSEVLAYVARKENADIEKAKQLNKNKDKLVAMFTDNNDNPLSIDHFVTRLINYANSLDKNEKSQYSKSQVRDVLSVLIGTMPTHKQEIAILKSYGVDKKFINAIPKIIVDNKMNITESELGKILKEYKYIKSNSFFNKIFLDQEAQDIINTKVINNIYYNSDKCN